MKISRVNDGHANIIFELIVCGKSCTLTADWRKLRSSIENKGTAC
jgi:hypothetical protein